MSGVNVSSNNSHVLLGRISNVKLPATEVRGLCMVGANAYSATTPSYVVVSPSGDLGIASTNTGTGKAVYFNLTWIA